MSIAAIIIIMLAALALEIFAASVGLNPPAVAMIAAAIAMRIGVMRGVVVMTAAAAFTDALWMHRVPSRCCALLAVLLWCTLWRRFGNTRGWLGMVAGGFGAALAIWICSMAMLNVPHWWSAAQLFASRALWSIPLILLGNAMVDAARYMEPKVRSFRSSATFDDDLW